MKVAGMGWSLRLRVFLFFALLACGAVAVIAGSFYVAWARSAPQPDIQPWVLAGALASFGLIGLIVAIWRLFDENVAHPLQVMAAQMRVLAAAPGTSAAAHLPASEARYLGDLAPAAQAISDKLSETQSDLSLAVQRETQALSDEKARLAALLADVSIGIVHCTADHTVVFYNAVARGLLDACAPPRLDQSIGQCLSFTAIEQAFAQLAAGGGSGEVTFPCATADGMRVFSASMRLVPQGGDTAGSYVLGLRDVTAQSGVRLAREALMADMIDDMRRRAAGVETLVALRQAAEPDPVTLALVDETRAFARAVGDLAQRYEDMQSEAIAGQQVLAQDLANMAVARLGAVAMPCDGAADDLCLVADGFQIVALIGHLGQCMRSDGRSHPLTLTIEPDADGAMVRLSWAGADVDMATLDCWLDADLDMGGGAFPARLILHQHGTEMWPERRDGQAALCLPLTCAADMQRPLAIRGTTYDFSLVDRARVASLQDMPLEALSYVVFDTETTGLLPTKGDEIVQIAALRVVGGRVIETEALDILVNPGRPIPEVATKVHGITQAMVWDAPGIDVAGAQMHAFSVGAVLVAHNAPFDMAFFHKHADSIGHTFEHPVVDTVLVSAVLFGITETHTLDALCDRLGIVIPQDLRHTAMGDTRATADAFVIMLGMLRARGIETFGQLHAAMEKQTRLYARS